MSKLKKISLAGEIFFLVSIVGIAFVVELLDVGVRS